jgi:hypothetical protein
MSIRRALGVWVLLAFLMSLNGVFRETVLVPTVQRRAADAASAVMGMAVILGVTRFFLIKFAGRSDAHAWRLASLWTSLTVAFEFLFGHYVDGKSWKELIENYTIWRGHLWPVVLLSLFLAPFLWTRKRKAVLSSPTG